MSAKPDWRGVFPAATTQFHPDLSIDLESTQLVVDRMIREGVNGIVALGTCGENNSLEPDEKRKLAAAVIEVAARRVPVIFGVSEFDSRRAGRYAADMERLGADGLMLLPAMVYVPTEAELERHFQDVAGSTGLPIMLYNNPPAYRVSISIASLRRLAQVSNIVAVKESSTDTRRFTDIINACGDRYVLFAGLDDVAFEGLSLGAKGWVSGLTNAFPLESVRFVDAMRRGDLDQARTIYRWFMPLLHLDAEHDLVQSIKLAEQLLGRGSERVRPPRLPLTGARRDQITALVERAQGTRPVHG